jgi:hypothetical protein
MIRALKLTLHFAVVSCGALLYAYLYWNLSISNYIQCFNNANLNGIHVSIMHVALGYVKPAPTEIRGVLLIGFEEKKTNSALRYIAKSRAITRRKK